jgi:hypothetical protein
MAELPVELFVETLGQVGAQAVGTVTGAGGTPGAGPLAALCGREVVLWPDAGGGGRHMHRIAAALAGIATRVRIFAPAGLPEGGDAVDWIEQRRAEGKPDAVILSELETTAATLPAHTTANKRTTVEPAGDPVEAALAAVGAAEGAAEMEGPLRQLSEALRGADSLRRAAVRERAIEAVTGKVSAPAHLVDSALAVERPATAVGQGRAVEFADPDPWPEAVDGAALLQDLVCTVSRYVALPAHAADAIALW